MLAPIAARAGFTTRATLSTTQSGPTLSNDTVYVVQSNTTINRPSGSTLSAMYVADGATAVIYIPNGVTLTVQGGNASGTESAGAGIRLNDGSTLVVTGGGTLNVTGGNAAGGANGGNGGNARLSKSKTTAGSGGNGGAGGGGASAGIGGIGGNGGAGGVRACWESEVNTNDDDTYDNNGPDGGNGGNGENGTASGKVYLLGTLSVTAIGGSASSSAGSRGSNGSGTDDSWFMTYNYRVGGGGGGAGGGSGYGAPYGIGGGGAGGGGGGAGGNGGRMWTTQGGSGDGSPSHRPNAAGGAAGSGYVNGSGHDRTAHEWTESATSSTRRWGGCGGYGGKAGTNGVSGTVYFGNLMTFTGTYDSSNVRNAYTGHDAIKYNLKFLDAQRVNETKEVYLGYAWPAAPMPPSRPGWAFHGWFSETDGSGTKYYDANGVFLLSLNEYAIVGDLTLYAHWTMEDPAAAGTISVDGIPLVAGVSRSDQGDGWFYDAGTGYVWFTTRGKRYVVTGKDEAGEFSLYPSASGCEIVMSNLTLNASINSGRTSFEVKQGSTANLVLLGDNSICGCPNYPAIYIPEGGTCNISGSGKLKATGGSSAPGIGGKVSDTSGTGMLNITGGTIEAIGGVSGSGIGAAKSSGFGTVTISGGTITATGTGGSDSNCGAAGIGGSQGAGMGTYRIIGGTVTARGDKYGPGIGSGKDAIGGVVEISGGTVTATGGDGAAGIGSGRSAKNFSVSISGGTVTATGGPYGAGIGGGQDATRNSISISDGTVTTTGGQYGAGIGSGDQSDNGTRTDDTISISGGNIRARAGSGAADIGSSDYGVCVSVSISGGTVQQKSGTSPYIGAASGDTPVPVIFTGGAIYASIDRVRHAPSNNVSQAVFPVDLDIGIPDSLVTSFEMGAMGDPFKNTYTDANGILRIWLPASNGNSYGVRITMEDGSEHDFCFGVSDDGKMETRDFLLVNGMIITGNLDQTNTEWTYATNTCVLTILNDATISGTSTNGTFRIVVPSTGSVSALTFKNLTLATKARDASTVKLERDVTLTLSGENAISAAGQYSAGIEVASSAALTINGDGTLVATGGRNAAGIGSAGGFPPPGKILIESGTIFAQGGVGAAGIGGGVSSTLDKEDNVVITGGRVAATGGSGAAGIGAGNGKATLATGAVRIAGGSVTATGSGSLSDLVKSTGNTVEPMGNDYTLHIDGGSVVPGGGGVNPRPTDSASNVLYAVSFTGLEPNKRVAVSSLTGDFPATYSLDDVYSDSEGRICLWLAPTNRVRIISVSGKFYETEYPYSGSSEYKEDITIDGTGGSDTPPDEIVIDGETRYSVTLPHLGAGAFVSITGLEAYGTTSAVANNNGDAFVYLPDGEYSFQVNGHEWAVAVDGAPASAHMITHVFANGVDVGWFSGEGWAYEPGTMRLTISGECVLSGTNTLGEVSCLIDTWKVATLSNLVLSTESRDGVPAMAIGSGTSATMKFAGESSLVSGRDAAGIEVPESHALSLSGAAGGTLDVTGGQGGAGIGSGAGGTCGAISISSGVKLTAKGRNGGAGIGIGSGGTGGTVTIYGGVVTATGDDTGAGIGAGEVRISGGTIFAAATGGSGAKAIVGVNNSSSSSVTITGGAVYPGLDDVAPAPVNGESAAVYPVDIPLGQANTKVPSLEIVRNQGAFSYGMTDAYTDDTGKLRIWLPRGVYIFSVPQDGGDPVQYAANVKNGAATAVVLKLTGLTVNGRDVGYLADEGWEYEAPAVTLASAMDYVVAGSATNVQVRVATNANVTIDCVLIDCSTNGISPFVVVSGADASLTLAGENTLIGGWHSAGLSVEGSASATISGDGALSATGGYWGAGIGGCPFAAVGTISIAGGTVAAMGGGRAAGIGGGYSCTGGTIAISRGMVTADGGEWASGIGAGDGNVEHFNSGIAVEITGGIVTARSEKAAGIGPSDYADCGAIVISGGTVFASTQGSTAKAIGRARERYASSASSVAITGGAVYSGVADVLPAPTDGASAVYPVDIPIGQANFKVETLSFGTSSIAYGTNDLYTDADGKLRIWLPNGDHEFVADGDTWTVHVDGAAATAYIASLGVMVNGTNVGYLSGEGWKLDRRMKIVSLIGAGPFTISGAGDKVAIRADADCAVVLDGLSLTNTVSSLPPFDCGTNSVSMSLSGENSLVASRENIPGLGVRNGGSLDITGGDGSLSAQGGGFGAGIGSGNGESGGSVSISGGTVLALGGFQAAGIGGGYASSGNSVAISGGNVTATGGKYGAGIGSGDQSGKNTWTGDAVLIQGGRISAVGGQDAMAIGSSDYGACASVTISGGTIMRSSGGATEIGASEHSPSGGGAIISGGAVYRATDGFSPAATNDAGLAVNFVDFDLQMPNAKIEDFEVKRGGAAHAYGVNDLYTDEDGHLRVWLPDGSYTFTADGDTWVASVAGAPTNAVLSSIGVTVNGVDIAGLSGEGWSYSRKQKILVLENAGPFTVSGSASGVLCSVTNACEVTLDSLSLDNSSADNRPGFSVVDSASVALTLVGENILKGGKLAAGLSVTGDGSLTATGGQQGAGIGGGRLELVGTVSIVGGTVSATGGMYAAGIGGGFGGTNCTIVISGGSVTATGGDHSAAIGSGDQWAEQTATGDNIVISGGVIRVSCPYSTYVGPAGVGSSGFGSCSAVTICGGTILSSGSPVRIGSGTRSSAGSVTISGGSIYSASDQVSPAASNATERVWCVTVPGLASNARVDGMSVRRTSGLSFVDYGTDDLFTDGSGKIYLWLPDGDYRFLVSQDGRDDLYFAASVDGADVEATPITIVPVVEGVTVNGKDIGYGFGHGWSFTDGVVHLVDAGPFEIAGSANGSGILAEADCAVTVTNLALNASSVERRAAFAIMVGMSVDLTLAGTNTLKSGENCAGLQVPAGAAVTIGGEGSVEAVGGRFGSGIGGARNVANNAGDITINGGTVKATGGDFSAGIGGGQNGNGGKTTITNGTVRATGGSNGAGIGGGPGEYRSRTSGGEIVISGGTVTATAGYVSAGIGGGNCGNAGTIAISGGVVSASGDQFGAGIGGGQYGAGGEITISGGLVTATSQSYAAAIGGGYEGGGIVRITGGTVVAAANKISDYAPTDIGAGRNAGAKGVVLVTGGSVHATKKGIVDPVASNATERVWCVEFPGFTPNAAVDLGEVKLNGAAWAYGAESIFADADGKIYLWLPGGENVVLVGGRLWYADVTGDAVTTAVLYENMRPTGVFVDGVEVARGWGEGWEWWPGTSKLTLAGDGPFVISGTNVEGKVRVRVETESTVTLSNLCLKATESRCTPFAITSNLAARVWFTGTNTLEAGRYCAALEVPGVSDLEIGGDGWLNAKGGAVSDSWGCPAIGISDGMYYEWGHGITITGGNFVALSGAVGTVDGIDDSVVFGGNIYIGKDPYYYTHDALAINAKTPQGDNAACIEVPELEPNAPVVFTGLPDYYNASNIVANAEGKVYIYLKATETTYFIANGQLYRVVATDSSAANTAQKVVYSGVDSLMIESIAVADDSVTLVVSAMPAGAAVQFMDLLEVVCAADLESLSSGDPSRVTTYAMDTAGVAATPNGDGTVTIEVPVAPSDSQMFYVVRIDVP